MTTLGTKASDCLKAATALGPEDTSRFLELHDTYLEAGMATDAAARKAAADLVAEIREEAGDISDAIRPLGVKADIPASSAADQSAASLIAEAAKLGVKGANEALTGLAKLFGAGTKGRLNSFGAGFDEDTYKQAKPHFQEALKAFQAAGKSLKDLFKMLIGQFGDGIKDYAIRFAKDEELTAQLGAAPSASTQVADRVAAKLAAGTAFDWRELFGMADEAFGGTQAEGKYTPKDAYDAMEAGVNRYILSRPGAFSPNASRETALLTVRELERMTALLPTQTKRTAEQDEFQQFSTVPPFAFVANWAANVTAADTMLEPSAGIGGLAVFSRAAGAKLVLNELSSRRAAVLQSVFPSAQVFHENAEQLHNILPDSVRPTVVVMNPPFSASAGRMQGRRDTSNGAQHVEQALERLEDGGRLVAIVGEGMALDRPAFKGWWDRIRKEYDVRAVIPVDGSGYAKYGTTFDNALLVIDKRKPAAGREIVDTKAATYADLIGLLSGIRDDRPAADAPTDALDREGTERDTAESALGGPVRDEQLDPGSRPDGGGPAGVGDGEPASGAALGQGRGGRGGAGRGNRPGRSLRQPGDAGTGDGPQPGGSSAPAASTSGGPDTGGDGTGLTVTASDAATAALTDSIFENYQPQRLKVPGAKPHPGPLVQSAAMASVLPPAPTYTPNLPAETIKEGKLSIAQIEAVVYAGQAHEQMLDNEDDKGRKYRRGFFIGDGTGVGKGREISGIILDNLRRGRKKHVWVSEKQGLMNDAKRDFGGVGGDDSLIFNQNKTKAEDGIQTADGILFTTYSTLRSGAQSQDADKPLTKAALEKAFTPDSTVVIGVAFGDSDRATASLIGFDTKAKMVVVRNERGYKRLASYDQVLSIDGVKDWQKGRPSGKEKKAGQSRLDQLVNWLGDDFDGVIVFDEAHNAGNAEPIKGERGTSEPSAQAMAVVDLQKRLPNARVVYVSATGATQVSNLSFATRLGLWGAGTPFPAVSNFVSQMTAGGLATMELVARDMKQMGSYVARSLSFDGVTYSRVEHELTDMQREIYNRLSDGWQVTLQNIMEALELTGVVSDGKTKNGRALAAAKSAYWGAQQRFFNQIITSMQMPSVVEQIRADLAAGEAVVLQLVNTNEAQQERSLAKKKEAGEEDLEDLDLTPRDQLIQMVEKSFPVVQFEEYTDDAGKTRSRPVESADGTPVVNRRAVAMRDKLVKDLQDIKVPDGPLEIILNEFGPDLVAEVTGRTQRVVRKPDADGNVKAQLETRGASAARADADAFMADKKRVLVFSDAGGTGFSFHADLTKPNQRHRSHYLIQPGWRADKAVQGFGRTHRTNQKSAPHYRLASTDVPAQKRFLSSIARRLDQLGALTKGQRDTANQGLFSEKDNLESKYATQAVRQLFDDAKLGQIDGLAFDDFLRQLGLEDIVNEDTGQIAENDYPKTSQFLNRMLSLRLDMQNLVFNAFMARMDEKVETAAQRGELDTGMQTIRALESTIAREETVYTDPRTGAQTQYVDLDLTQPTTMYPFPSEATQGSKIEWVQNAKSGRVWGKVRSGNVTKKNGDVLERYRMLGTSGTQIKDVSDFKDGAYIKISADKARSMWEQETAARPKTYTTQAHMIVGAILPIWDRLPMGSMQVARTQTTDGRRLLGRVIAEKDVADTLKNLNVESAESKLPPATVLARVLKGEVGTLANGWNLMRKKVSDDLRIELMARNLSGALEKELTSYGVISERINWQTRFFVPTDAAGAEALGKILKTKPLVSLLKPDADNNQAQFSLSSAPSGGRNAAAVQKEVEQITAGWANSPQVVVLDSMADPRVPAAARAAAADRRNSGAAGSPEGFFLDGKVYLVANQLAKPADTARVLLHEALGHAGLRGVFGPGLNDVLDRFADSMPAKVAAKAKAYGLDMSVLEQRRQAAEEALAELAQTRPTLGSVQRLIAAVRAWLREHIPGFGSMKMSDAEVVQQFIAPAQGWVERGSGLAAGPARFSVSLKAAEDLPAQEQWLQQQARAAGFRDIDDMLERDYPAFEALAKQWRADHPADVMFSLSSSLAGAMNNARDVKLGAGYVFGDLMDNGTGKLGWWHKSVGTMHNLAQRNPLFKRVYDSAQNFINDVSWYATEAANEAPSILPKMETWRDLGKSPLSAEDTKAMSRAVFEGTIGWVRDAAGKPVKAEDAERAAAGMTSDEKAHELMRAGKLAPEVLRMWQGRSIDQFDAMVGAAYERDMLTPGVVWSDAEMRSLFGMSPGQIKLYREARASIDKSLTNLAISDLVRFAGKDAADVREQALAAKTVDQAALILRDRLFELAGENETRAEVLNDTGNRVMEKAGKITRLIEHGYAPLMRFGELTLDVVGQGGERLFFSLYESRIDRAMAKRKLAEQFPGATITEGTTSQEQSKLFQGITPETLELFGEMIGLEAQGTDTGSQLFQQYLKVAKDNRSALKRLIHRKGTAGFSDDAARVLAGFVYSNARLNSRNLHQGEMTAAASAIPKSQGELQDAAVRLTQYVSNPAEEAAAIKGLIFANFLGGSIASAMVNATQPFTVAMPYLSRWGGITKAGKRMAQATKDALERRTGDAALDKAMAEAEEKGVVSPQEVHQLIGQAAGKGALRSGDGTTMGNAYAQGRNAVSRFVMGWGKVFSIPEQFNRRVTFIAAYRTAVQEGMADPAAFAEQAVNDTMFVYCVDDETECLTTAGWRRRWEMRPGDQIVGIDANGAAMVSPLIDVHHFPGQQKATKFSNSTKFSMVLTGGHDTIVQCYNSRDRKWQGVRKVKAENLKRSHHLLRAPVAAVSREDSIGSDMAALLGWVAAEGNYVALGKKTPRKQVRITQSQQHNPEYVAEIESLLNRLGGGYSKHFVKGGEMVIFVLRKDLSDLIVSDMPEKLLTWAMVEKLSAREMTALIESFAKGDGHSLREGGWLIGQKHEQNLHVLQAMSALTGANASYYQRDGERNSELYLHSEAKRTHVASLQRETVTIDGAWCPETGNGTWIARRGGSIFVTGNTKANRPRWARGFVGSLAFTFKTFSISYVELLHRMATQGGPEGRRAALYSLGVLFLMAGMQGLPGSDDLDDIIDGALQRLGYNWTTKQRRRELLAGFLGEGAADFMLHGISGLPGSPIDVSGRMGLGNLIPGTGLLTKKADYTRDITEVAGPVATLASNYFNAAGAAIQGDIGTAAFTALPVAAQNMTKALDMWSTGMYRDQRGRKVIDVDGFDAAVKALGFQPGDVSKVQDASRMVQQGISLNKIREAEIADRWALGRFEKDPDKVKAAREEMDQWNRDNPSSPIRIDSAQIIKRVREMNKPKSERLAATAPKEIRAAVRRDLEGL